MKRTLFITLFAISFLVISAATAAAQKATVDGAWDAGMNTPGGVRNFQLVFKTNGEKLTGTVKRTDGEIPLAGTVKGSDISFSYTITYNGHDLVLGFTGKLDGDSIKG